jgi:histidine triad (HIT) family protein
MRLRKAFALWVGALLSPFASSAIAQSPAPRPDAPPTAPASHGNTRERGLDGNYDEQNPFARILRGELAYEKVYEDAHTLAFIPLRMRTRGHTLVIPKAKARNITQIDPADLAHVMATVQKVARAQAAVLGAKGITLVQNNGEYGDQSVFHLHVHVIPRYPGIDMQPPVGPDDPIEQRHEVAQELAAFFATNR